VSAAARSGFIAPSSLAYDCSFAIRVSSRSLAIGTTGSDPTTTTLPIVGFACTRPRTIWEMRAATALAASGEHGARSSAA
jgi:hypothetical protein